MSGNRPLLRLAAAFYLGAVAAAWLYAWVFGHTAVLYGERPPDARGWLQGVGLGVGIAAMGLLAHAALRPVRRAGAVIARVVGPLSWRDALALALLSGFAEELLFRGALWPHLGLVGSAVIFGILHTIPVRALAGYPIYAFLAGLVLGLLRQETGSIWPAVACHATVNAITLGWLGARERRRLGRRILHHDAVASPKAQESQPLPVPQEVDERFPRTVWRYHVRLELEGTDRLTLPECLEAEDLALFQIVPREEVEHDLREGIFVFSEEFHEPFVAFPDDISAISTYLFQVVTGIEVAERMVDEETTDDVRAWKITSRRGEWVKVPLVVESAEPGTFEVDPDKEDLDVMAAHWNEYPRWFQDGMRFRYPALRDL